METRATNRRDSLFSRSPPLKREHRSSISPPAHRGVLQQDGGAKKRTHSLCTGCCAPSICQWCNCISTGARNRCCTNDNLRPPSMSKFVLRHSYRSKEFTSGARQSGIPTKIFWHEREKRDFRVAPESWHSPVVKMDGENDDDDFWLDVSIKCMKHPGQSYFIQKTPTLFWTKDPKRFFDLIWLTARFYLHALLAECDWRRTCHEEKGKNSSMQCSCQWKKRIQKRGFYRFYFLRWRQEMSVVVIRIHEFASQDFHSSVYFDLVEKMHWLKERKNDKTQFSKIPQEATDASSRTQARNAFVS